MPGPGISDISVIAPNERMSGMAIGLVVVDGSNIIKVAITDQAIVLGRLPECQVVLQDPAVENKHCSFILVGGRTLLTDLQSTEGTFVNNSSIRDTFIFIGDIMRLGGTTSMYLDPSVMTPEEKKIHTKQDSRKTDADADATVSTDLSLSEIIRPNSIRPVANVNQVEVENGLREKVGKLVEEYLHHLPVKTKEAINEEVLRIFQIHNIPSGKKKKEREKEMELTNSSLKIDLSGSESSSPLPKRRTGSKRGG